MLDAKVVYVIGQLNNPMVPVVAGALRDVGVDAYDQWFCPGPEADLYWQAYCAARGWTYKQALEGWHAKHIREIDQFHLDQASLGVVVYPAGRSALMEAGYLVGQGKPVILAIFEEPERYDVMPGLVLSNPRSSIVTTMDELLDAVRSWASHDGPMPGWDSLHPAGQVIDVTDDGCCLCHGIKVV